ncbi:MAG: HD domain-containing protein [Lachnospiraceae bacterium]|jgi:putative nucleotidyltransferase with HDIG domain|nr:HD domain-containing protein [Lachnospiraceae bacterium]
MNISRPALIFGLSYALDIAGKNNLSHSKSTAYLAVSLARELELEENTALAIYYAALLHDIGISNEYVLYEHCLIGKEMLEKLPLPADLPLMVLYHHELYDGSGPHHLAGEDIPLGAQIIALSSAFDDRYGRVATFDFARFTDISAWLDGNHARYSPRLIERFKQLVKRESFLLDYFNHETKYLLADKVAIADTVTYQYEEVQKYALCFADIIDRRSPFTYTHSRGIADLARRAAIYLGYDEYQQNNMYLAGLLHDIGKLHVSTEILHKNGRLTPEERFEINKHTYYTRKILEQIAGFEPLIDIAANHHEKMDGTGYPNRTPGHCLSEPERIMAICDVYQALTEERPYREPLPAAKVWSIIDEMAGSGHLDPQMVNKAKEIFI